MPPLPLVPNVIKIVNECQGNDGRLAANVLHWTYGGSAPNSDVCVDIAGSFWDLWNDNFIPLMPAQTSLVQTTVTDLSTSTGGEGTYNNDGTPAPGTSAHGMLPLHSCFLVSMYVEERYRGGHPRMYLPVGTTDDLNDDGDWKSTSVSAFMDAWSNIITDFVRSYTSTELALQCAVSYYSGTDPTTRKPIRRDVPLVYDIPVDGYTGQEKLATQRRRVRKTARRR
jgi:hypothetical protein